MKTILYVVMRRLPYFLKGLKQVISRAATGQRAQLYNKRLPTLIRYSSHWYSVWVTGVALLFLKIFIHDTNLYSVKLSSFWWKYNWNGMWKTIL